MKNRFMTICCILLVLQLTSFSQDSNSESSVVSGSKVAAQEQTTKKTEAGSEESEKVGTEEQKEKREIRWWPHITVGGLLLLVYLILNKIKIASKSTRKLFSGAGTFLIVWGAYSLNLAVWGAILGFSFADYLFFGILGGIFGDNDSEGSGVSRTTGDSGGFGGRSAGM